MAVTQGWHGWSISGKNLQLSEIATILLIFGQTGTFLCDDYPLSISEVGVKKYACRPSLSSLGGPWLCQCPISHFGH